MRRVNKDEIRRLFKANEIPSSYYSNGKVIVGLEVMVNSRPRINTDLSLDSLSRNFINYKFQVDENTLQKSKVYATTVLSTSRTTYGNRGEGTGEAQDRRNIQKNISAKISEEVLRNFIQHYGMQVSDVDFKIYQDKGKSWRSDLFILDRNRHKVKLHSKSQEITQANIYNASVTAQWDKNKYNTKDCDQELFGDGAENSNDLVVFTITNPPTGECVIIGALTIAQLHQKNLFQLPILKDRWDHKRCIYIMDILNTCEIHELWTPLYKLILKAGNTAKFCADFNYGIYPVSHNFL